MAEASFHLPDPTKIIKEIKHAVEGGLHDVKHAAESATAEARHQVDLAEKSAVGSVHAAGDEVLAKAKQELDTYVVQKAQDLLQTGQQELQAEAQKVLKEMDLSDLPHLLEQVKQLGEGLEDQVSAIFKSLLEALSGQLAAEAAKVLAHLAQAAADRGITANTTVKFGPVSFEVDDLAGRAAYFAGLAEKPPRSFDDIKGLVRELAPDQVTVEFDAALALLVATSDTLSVGLAVTVSRDSFEAMLDVLVDAIT